MALTRKTVKDYLDKYDKEIDYQYWRSLRIPFLNRWYVDPAEIKTIKSLVQSENSLDTPFSAEDFTKVIENILISVSKAQGNTFYCYLDCYNLLMELVGKEDNYSATRIESLKILHKEELLNEKNILTIAWSGFFAKEIYHRLPKMTGSEKSKLTQKTFDEIIKTVMPRPSPT